MVDRLADYEPGILPRRGDYDLNPELMSEALRAAANLTPAAVLIPVIDRGDEASVLFTQRTEALPSHAGQVSFPGGKIDEGDDGPYGAALREAHEEIGLESGFVEILGELDSYQTGTGFHIHPVVAIVAGDAPLVPNEQEVADVFEVPLRYVMEPANHQEHKVFWQGKDRHFYAISYGDRYIWGATAGILRNLYERLYS